MVLLLQKKSTSKTQSRIWELQWYAKCFQNQRCAGDGTTTATVLATGNFPRRIEKCDCRSQSYGPQRGIDLAVKAVTEGLKEISRDVEAGKK